MFNQKTLTYKGFSLIELMIVVAIIGILASIALPSYNAYIMRGKITAIIDIFEKFKLEFNEALMTNGICPNTVRIMGVDFPANTNTPFPYGYLPDNPISSIAYFVGGTSNNSCFITANLNPYMGAGSPGIASTLKNGSILNYCGFYATGYQGTTMPYMPSTCRIPQFYIYL